jgi:SOS-response transcriptional repressor LexA
VAGALALAEGVFVTADQAEYAILELALPGRPPANFGVLLLDPISDTLRFRLRADHDSLADDDDAEVLSCLEEDFAAKIREIGGRRFLEQLEDSLSNVLRLTTRRPARVRDLPRALDRLFDEHVRRIAPGTTGVIPFVTHMPLYSLRAAAGKFGEDLEVEPEEWIEAPAGMRLTRDMYAVHVTGRSMEPRIPDGSLAVFRYAPAGSRQGKTVLVWRKGASDTGGEFTVKVYESRKAVTEDGWRHEGIRLRPLNPEFDILELGDSEEFAILGELVRVLPG